MHTIINKINESRDQSEFSVITEPKTHYIRPIPINFTPNNHYQQVPNLFHMNSQPAYLTQPSFIPQAHYQPAHYTCNNQR
jgi:hypothetical protein